jgi:hypothetical protein
VTGSTRGIVDCDGPFSFGRGRTTSPEANHFMWCTDCSVVVRTSAQVHQITTSFY